MIFELEFPH